MSTKLGHLLVEEGLLSEQDRKTIQEASGSAAGAFAKGILALGLLGEDELAAFVADRTQFRVAAKDIFAEIDDRALGAIDTPLLRQLEVIPLRLDSNVLAVAMIDPLDRATIHQLEFFTGCKIKPLIATLKQVRMGLARLIPGYTPEPSAFEAFMQTHMRLERDESPKVTQARELIARVKETPGPVVADVDEQLQDAPVAPEPVVAEPAGADPEGQASDVADAPEVQATPPEGEGEQTQEAGDADEAINGNTDSTESDPAPELAAQDTPNDTADAGLPEADEAAGSAEVKPLKPDFGVPPAVAGNETAANKALLTLNKRAMDVSVDSEPVKALSTLVAALYEIGLQTGAILIRYNADLADTGVESASWFNQETANGLGFKEAQGSHVSDFVEAVANYAPESMDSDGWLQIKTEDQPSVAACLDLFDAGESRSEIESGLTAADTILMARAFKLAAQDADLIAVLNWSMETAGHEALRASVSNAVRAFGQKVPKK